MAGVSRFWLGLFVAICHGNLTRGDDDIRQSVVKIEVTKMAPNFLEPWKREQPKETSGTGVIISGNRILTNSHVISHARSITVQPFQSATKSSAKVIASTVGMDLAVLSVEEESFFEGRPALEFDEKLPLSQSTVNAYGFPFGGTQISVTEGIVSRIEFDRYYMSSKGLRIQIDAALNPGNSGGPAVQNGRMVGLVFSRISEGDNVGYLIPIEEIKLFLDDIEDGAYDGKLTLSHQVQTLENKAIRRKLGLTKEVGAVMVSELLDKSDDAVQSDSTLREWDVITKIDDHPIDREGKVKLGDENRVDFAYLVQKHSDDNTVKLSLIRDGNPIDVDVELSRGESWLAGPIGSKYPRYFVAGPLVFTPGSAELARRLISSRRWMVYLTYRKSPLITRLYERIGSNNDEKLVVTGAGFLPHPITQGYSEPMFGVVEKLNGVNIRNLKQLVELLRDSQEEYFVFEFAGNGCETLVFDRVEFLDATEQVLDDNGIRKRATIELLQVWNDRPTK